MKKTGLLWMLLWMLPSGIYAQHEKVYELLTLPATQRSLTLYRGQFQVNAAYLHGLGTRKYDHHGTRLSFEESRGNFLANELSLDLSYGIIDFLELATGICYFSQTESMASVNYWNGDYLNEVSSNRDIRGPGHLKMSLSVKQPFFDSDFDFAIRSGISFPIFSHTPPEPDHSIVYYNPSDPDGPYTLNYLHRFKPSPNVSMFNLGIDTKLLMNRFALTLTGFYKAPLAAEQTLLWTHTLVGNQFHYQTTPYKRLPARISQIHFTPAFQAYPWFTVYLSFVHQGEAGGWTEENGSRFGIPERSLGTLSPGFEIMVSAFFRFVQYIDIPVYGKSTYSYFSIRSGISVNMLPSKAHYE